MSALSEVGAIINTSPRPRLLVSGFDGEEGLVEKILALCPTSREVKNFSQVRQAEWDVLVTTNPLIVSMRYRADFVLDPHISVVYVAKQGGHFDPIEARVDWAGSVRNGGRKVSQEIRRVRGLPERVAMLVHERLEPILIKREFHDTFAILRHGMGHSGEIPAPNIEPFIETPDGDILAGRYKRSDISEAWLLPHDTPDVAEWVKSALAEWNALSPDRFPGVPDWSRQLKWMTAEERGIVAQIAEVDQDRRKVLTDLAEKDRELRGRLLTASQRADGFERALLTTQSDELKAAVILALRALGFIVTDADEQAAPDDHLEDLHIEDAERPGWIALGEVKGYTRGARTEGITQFLRFNMRYAARAKSVPDANWYIVNQFLGRDPSTRQKALHGKDEDVAAFGEGCGLVIDTVELFKLLSAVEGGSLTRQDAKRLLSESSGRFVFSE
ncbi:hypothetical protein ACMZ5F_16650 [Streptomyces rhizosphaericola]|uniref:hypothetical protein n=1 Tax=Streptomyces rhizosphaericola TaxID=2564098 RepID=UPI0039EF3F42